MAEKKHRRGGKKNRKHGRNAKKPSTIRYWQTNRLERHKVRNLMRHNGMTRAEATCYWRGVRKRRAKNLPAGKGADDAS